MKNCLTAILSRILLHGLPDQLGVTRTILQGFDTTLVNTRSNWLKGGFAHKIVSPFVHKYVQLYRKAEFCLVQYSFSWAFMWFANKSTEKLLGRFNCWSACSFTVWVNVYPSVLNALCTWKTVWVFIWSGSTCAKTNSFLVKKQPAGGWLSQNSPTSGNLGQKI